MAVVVVGGSGRKVGKTSAVCALIRATPELHWVAVKVTTHGHGTLIDVREETRAGEENDSSRYLEAGAVRSFYVSAPEGTIAEAMLAVQTILGKAENAVVESTSAVEFFKPDIAVLIGGYDTAEMKDSARRLADRFDSQVATADDALSFVLSRLRTRL